MSWSAVPLGKLMVDGLPSVDPAKYSDELFELWSIPAFDSGKPDFEYGREIGSQKKLVQESDVLLSRIVPHIRRSWVVTRPQNGVRQIASGEWIVFRSDSFHPAYLRHVLMSDAFHNEFMMTVAGVGGSLLRARPESVKSIRIPLPPLTEQKRIAAILDAADALRAKRRVALAMLDELSDSMFIDRFARPRSAYKVSRLSDLTSRITDGVHQKPNYTEDGIAFISVKDITTGILKFEKCKFISEEDHLRFTRRCKAERGDVLYTKVGATYGRPALVDTDREFSLYVSVCLIKPKRDLVEPAYLCAALGTSAVKRQADRKIKGIGVPDLHLDQIQSFQIPVPPISEQRQFVDELTLIANSKALSTKAFEESDYLFKSLQSRAFRGEL